MNAPPQAELRQAAATTLLEVARKLECDDNRDCFEKRPGKIAKAKPKGEPKKG
jgi:hypothetical protein